MRPFAVSCKARDLVSCVAKLEAPTDMLTLWGPHYALVIDSNGGTTICRRRPDTCGSIKTDWEPLA